VPFWAGVAIAVAVDAGVVDDGVHPAELVDLVGEVDGLLGAAEIADDQGCTAVDQVRQRGRAVGVAGVDDDLVPVVEQGGGGGSAESLGGTGDQDASHEGSLVRLVS
jgi:hypothetical protein